MTVTDKLNSTGKYTNRIQLGNQTIQNTANSPGSVAFCRHSARKQDGIIPQRFQGCMDGWLGFNSILSTQIAAISCLRTLSFISKYMNKRDYPFRKKVIEAIFQTRSCTEILANDIKIYNALKQK